MKKWLIALVCCILLALLFLSFTTYKIQSNKSSTATGTYQTIIILGAKVKLDGSLSLSLKNRLDTALDYAKDDTSYTFIVTGGQGDDEPIAEAVAMQQYLIENGIEENRIIVEDTSTSTYQNLQNAKALLDGKLTEATIVSNDFHLARALFLAKQLDIKADTLAAPTPPSVYTKSMIREHLALMKTYVFRK